MAHLTQEQKDTIVSMELVGNLKGVCDYIEQLLTEAERRAVLEYQIKTIKGTLEEYEQEYEQLKNSNAKYREDVEEESYRRNYLVEQIRGLRQELSALDK